MGKIWQQAAQRHNAKYRGRKVDDIVVQPQDVDMAFVELFADRHDSGLDVDAYAAREAYDELAGELVEMIALDKTEIRWVEDAGELFDYYQPLCKILVECRDSYLRRAQDQPTKPRSDAEILRDGE